MPTTDHTAAEALERELRIGHCQSAGAPVRCWCGRPWPCAVIRAADFLRDALAEVAAEQVAGEITGELLRSVTAECEALRAKLDAQCAECLRVAEAIGSVEFMDPPDGGNVPLSEQVRRMRAKLDALAVPPERHSEDAALEALDERDSLEDFIADAARAAGCEQEWSNLHDHRDCVMEACRSLAVPPERPDLAKLSEREKWELCADVLNIPGRSAHPTAWDAWCHYFGSRLETPYGRRRLRDRILALSSPPPAPTPSEHAGLVERADDLLHADGDEDWPSRALPLIRDMRDALSSRSAPPSPPEEWVLLDTASGEFVEVWRGTDLRTLNDGRFEPRDRYVLSKAAGAPVGKVPKTLVLPSPPAGQGELVKRLRDLECAALATGEGGGATFENAEWAAYNAAVMNALPTLLAALEAQGGK